MPQKASRAPKASAAPKKRPLATTLPASAYFDEALFVREQSRIFARLPRYLAHEISLPQAGDYLALPQESEARALLRQSDGSVTLLSNVCRHRQALMLKGRGSALEQIVCPLHRWTYDRQGQLLGAPHFPANPCLHLRQTPLTQWNGLLFEESAAALPSGLEAIATRADLDFSGYVYDRTILHECNYNWKTFIEVYLEDYHVVPFHPGLGRFVDCGALRWEFQPGLSVQTVGIHNSLVESGTAVYERWQRAVRQYFGVQSLPRHGAIWLTLYPSVMVEWYPGTLVVSSLHPLSPQKTLNVIEYFYQEEIQAFEREFVEAEQAAYMETCAEDDEIALRMDAGRHALMQRGEDDFGPYQTPTEDGMQHFHAWYSRIMGTAPIAAKRARR